MLKKYPSPVKTVKFKKYWEKYLPIIANKKGFDKSVLKNIEILCRLYMLFDDLTEYIDSNPLLEENETRYGRQIKPNPALNERAKVITEVRHLSKSLGMKIDPEGTEEDVSSEWD